MNLTITQLGSLRNQTNYQLKQKENLSVQTRPQITSLSDFPKCYIQIPFKGNSELIPKHKNGIAKSEKEFSMEDKAKIQSRYLWGKNWDEEEAKQRFTDDANNEIEIKRRAALFGLKKSTKLKIKENYRQKFLAEKADAKEASDLAYIYPITVGTIKDIRALSIAENFKNAPTSLDTNIAGYENEKKYLREAFVDTIAAEKAGRIDSGVKGIKIPNGLILHGPTGCGKTVIARALAEETGCEVFDLPTSTESKDFGKIIQKQLDIAKERYLNEGKRTIIIINEMDNYLDDSVNNIKNLAAMKGVLDFCADQPNAEKYDSRFGTTFIFTTNHPSKIDTDLFLRPEKIEERIKLMPPEGTDFEKVLKHYVDIAQETIEEEIIKGRKVKPISADLPYDKIAEYCTPTKEKGAFSCAKLKQIAESATRKYLADNNEKEFSTLLRDGLLAKRDITPQKMNQYNKELEEIQGKTLSRIEELSEARAMGFITHDELEELYYLENLE